MDNIMIIDTSILQHYIRIFQKKKRNNMIKVTGKQAIKEIKMNPVLSKQETESAESLIRRLFGFDE